MTKEISEKQRMWRIAGRYSSLGIELAFSISLPALAGNWADERFGIEPFGVLFGVVVGIGASVQAIRRIILFREKEKF